MDLHSDWHLVIQMVILMPKVIDLAKHLVKLMVKLKDLRLVKRMRLVIVKDWRMDFEIVMRWVLK